MEKRRHGAGFWCSVVLVLGIVVSFGSREAEASLFVPPVAGPIRYSPCPVNSGSPFDENVPQDWYSVVWSGQYSEVTGSRCEGSGGHPGVDIRDAYGENTGDFGVFAIGAGIVIVKKNLGKGWGRTVVIQHDNVPGYGTIYSIYAHLASFEPIGGTVEAGQKIGTMGYSGLGNDPNQRHLHFQIEVNWNDLSKQGVERCSRKGKPFWPCYTGKDKKGMDIHLPYPSSDKTCGSEIDNCLTEKQRQEAAAYVAKNTINPMWLVETVSRSSWPMFQHDAQHTGHSTDTSIAPPLTQRWTYVADGMITSSPTIADGVVYFGSSGLVGSSDGKVHAVDANRGTVRWTYNTDPSIWSAASVSGNRIYVAGSSSLGAGTFLYALNASDGNEIWKVRLGPSGGGTSSPVVFDGVVYVGSGGSPSGSCPPEGHKVYAISTENGDVLWAAPIVDPNECRKDVLSSPAVTQDSVVVGTSGSCFVCPTVFAFDRLTGAFKWSAIAYTPYIFPAPSIAGGVVYVRSGGAGHGGDLIAFDEQTGTEVWRSGVGSFYNEGSPAIADGIVYTASGFQIHALDAITGATIWTVPAASAGTCAFGAFIRYPFFAVADGLMFIKSGHSCPR